MSKHGIREIEIRTINCVKDFQTEGFGRVNLMGGKIILGKQLF